MAISELLGIEAFPVPSQAQVTVVVASDGIGIRTARWRPTARKGPKGTVVVMGGRAEFIERYSEVIMELRRRGFHVVAFDWRGQGGSDRSTGNGRKGHVRRFGDYLHDIDIVMTDIMPKMPKPWFGLAHSMGAALCLEAARQNRLPLNRLVALAPMIGLSMVEQPRLAKVAAFLLDSLFLGKSFVPGGGETSIATKPFQGNRLTNDPERYARNAALSAARPELAVGDPTIRWVQEAFAFMNHISDPATPLDIRLPTLVIAAGADPVVSTPAVERFAARLKTGLALVLPGSKHEIVHETDNIRDKFWAAFDAFIPGEITLRTEPRPLTVPDNSSNSPLEKREGSLMDAPVTSSDDAPATRS
ncbi:MAG: alpha/beta fold hydrolase [Bosea sp. (in: a-proteobacteria)]